MVGILYWIHHNVIILYCVLQQILTKQQLLLLHCCLVAECRICSDSFKFVFTFCIISWNTGALLSIWFWSSWWLNAVSRTIEQKHTVIRFSLQLLATELGKGCSSTRLESSAVMNWSTNMMLLCQWTKYGHIIKVFLFCYCESSLPVSVRISSNLSFICWSFCCYATIIIWGKNEGTLLPWQILFFQTCF